MVLPLLPSRSRTLFQSRPPTGTLRSTAVQAYRSQGELQVEQRLARGQRSVEELLDGAQPMGNGVGVDEHQARRLTPDLAAVESHARGVGQLGPVPERGKLVRDEGGGVRGTQDQRLNSDLAVGHDLGVPPQSQTDLDGQSRLMSGVVARGQAPDPRRHADDRARLVPSRCAGPRTAGPRRGWADRPVAWGPAADLSPLRRQRYEAAQSVDRLPADALAGLRFHLSSEHAGTGMTWTVCAASTATDLP